MNSDYSFFYNDPNSCGIHLCYVYEYDGGFTGNPADSVWFEVDNSGILTVRTEYNNVRVMQVYLSC